LSDEAAVYAERVKRAAQLLLLQRHRQPGVRGWELKRTLGKNYLKVVDLLNLELEKIGFTVKALSDEGGGVNPKKLNDEQVEKARFFLTPTSRVTTTDARVGGWRVDDLAVLTVALAYIGARQGKAPRGAVEKLLKEKLPHWRVDINLDRFTRLGYLDQDKDEMLSIGWRSRAEIDQKTLVNLLLAEDVSKTSQ
jgi:hypothetical protein